jgi:hypothetical protein
MLISNHTRQRPCEKKCAPCRGNPERLPLRDALSPVFPVSISERRKSPVSDAAFEAALRSNDGNFVKTAEALNLTRQAVAHRVRTNPDRWGPVLEDIDDTLLDLAESNVATLLRQGDRTTTLAVMKHRGARRGWVARQELTGKDGRPLFSVDEALASLPDDVLSALVAARRANREGGDTGR